MVRFKGLEVASAVALALGLVACGPNETGSGAPPAQAVVQAEALSAGGSPRVIPPSARPFGLSYGEWSARHWQWTYSMPADHHPLTDTADCSAGQAGRVWFLGGTFAPTDKGGGVFVGNPPPRNCTVPAGTALFFPVLDAECSTAEGNGTTDAELRACAKGLMDAATDLRATIDGITVPHLQRFRVQSPLFQFGPLPAGNLLGLPAGTTSPAVSDGTFLMLAPLSVGAHTIQFSGAVVLPGFRFTLDITYHLTVAPRAHERDE